MRPSRPLVWSYAAVILIGVLLALPNILSPELRAKLPGWLPDRAVTLGLDLRGGSHLVLEVDADALIGNRLQTIEADARKLLRENDIAVTGVARRDHEIRIALAKSDALETAKAERTLAELVTSAAPLQFGQMEKDIDIDAKGPGAVSLKLTEAGIRDRVNAAIEQLSLIHI